MKDLLHKIFPDNYYLESEKDVEIKGTKFDWSYLVCNRNKNVNDFYLFLNIPAKKFVDLHGAFLNNKKITELLLKNHWIYELKKSVYKIYIQSNESLIKSDWEKNISLIILLDCSEYDPRQDMIGSNVLFDFEENPYSFKKSIVFYTKKELTVLKGELGGQDIKAYLNRVINDISYFSDYKNNKNESSIIYSLVSQLFIKIPFLTLPNTFAKESLRDLTEVINESLQKENLKKLKDNILELDSKFELNEEIIDKLYSQ